jgi:hypothetical protein
VSPNGSGHAKRKRYAQQNWMRIPKIRKESVNSGDCFHAGFPGRSQQYRTRQLRRYAKRRESGSPDAMHPVRAQPTTPTANERNPRATEVKVLCKFLEIYHSPEVCNDGFLALKIHEPANADYALVRRTDPKSLRS